MLLLHSNTWYYRYIFHWFTVWVSCLDNTKPPLYFSHFFSLIRHWRTCYLKLGTCSGPLMWLSPRWCHTDLQQRSHKSTRELQNEAIQKEPLGCSFCEQGTLPFFYLLYTATSERTSDINWDWYVLEELDCTIHTKGWFPYLMFFHLTGKLLNTPAHRKLCRIHSYFKHKEDFVRL